MKVFAAFSWVGCWFSLRSLQGVHGNLGSVALIALGERDDWISYLPRDALALWDEEGLAVRTQTDRSMKEYRRISPLACIASKVCV